MDGGGEIRVEMPEAPREEEQTGKKKTNGEAKLRQGEFVIQAILALILFLFACVNLSMDPKGVMSNFWIAMVSMIVGTFMPNPKLKYMNALVAHNKNL